MQTDDGRRAARERVNDELVRRPWSPAELARKAGVDSDTVNDFLAGKRWPQGATRGKLSLALDWPAEGIDMIARGEEPATTSETVRPDPQDDGVLLSLPPEALEGLGPVEREELVAGIRYRALQLAREIRRRVDDEAHDR